MCPVMSGHAGHVRSSFNETLQYHSYKANLRNLYNLQLHTGRFFRDVTKSPLISFNAERVLETIMFTYIKNDFSTTGLSVVYKLYC